MVGLRIIQVRNDSESDDTVPQCASSLLFITSLVAVS